MVSIWSWLGHDRIDRIYVQGWLVMTKGQMTAGGVSTEPLGSVAGPG